MADAGRRVMVVGGCGAGKSTFSKKLAQLTGLPLTHLDRLGWRENWEKTPREAFDALLAGIYAGEEWIIDGNWSRTIGERLRRADTVFWFRFTGIQCFAGVVERFFRTRGKNRDDMADGCVEKLDLEKLRFFHTTLWGAKRTNRRIEACLKDAPDVRVVVFRTRRQADRYLRELAEEKQSEREGTDGGMG